MYGTRTVIQAIAAGREVASEMDKDLGGDGDIREVLAPVEVPEANIGKVEGFGDLPRAEEQFLTPEARENSFTPISGGLCDGEACGEAARCLQCDLRFRITGHRLWSDYMEDKEGAAQ